MQSQKLKNSQTINFLVIATQLLTELEDEQAWKTRFAATTDQQWDQLAAKIRQEIANGEIPLDDVFPT
jgi:hypothetical protein